MKPLINHPWNISVQEAKVVQDELRDEVIQADRFDRLDTIAGVDVSSKPGSSEVRAALAILSFPDLILQESFVAGGEVSFPYVPGYLSFREIPPLLRCFDQVERRPDLVICDGHGLAHPRRFGLACHLGVLFGLASIGVGKSRLIGSYDEPGMDKGAHSPLVEEDEIIGAALRSRSNTKPIFVSIGHKVSLESSIETILASTPKYRLPEPSRVAHKLSRKE